MNHFDSLFRNIVKSVLCYRLLKIDIQNIIVRALVIAMRWDSKYDRDICKELFPGFKNGMISE